MLAIYQGRVSKHYVIMGSPAPIYQSLEEDGATDAEDDGDGERYVESVPARDFPRDWQDVSFYECRQRKCFKSPDAFDYCCLAPADYLTLRETHELSDVSDHASACDIEQVAACVAREQDYFRRLSAQRPKSRAHHSIAAPRR